MVLVGVSVGVSVGTVLFDNLFYKVVKKNRPH